VNLEGLPLPVRRLLTASAAHGFFAVCIGMLFLLPVFLREQGASRALVGFAMGLASGVGVAVRPLSGWALDRWGRRPVILAGGLICIAGGALYLGAEGPDAYLFAARILTGAAGGMLFAAYFTYAADVVPEDRRAQGIALFGLSGMVPMSAAPALGERLVAWGGYQALFIAILCCSILSFAFSLRLVESAEKSEGFETNAVGDFITVLKHTPLTPVFLLAGFFGAGIAAAFTFTAPAAVERGIGAASPFFLSYGALSAAVRIFTGHLSDKYGHARVAGPCLLAFAAALAVLASTRSTAGLVIAGALGGISHGYLFPAASAMAVARAPERLRGTAIAALTGLIDLCFLIFAPILGRVGDIGGFPALFWTASLIAAAGFAVFVVTEKALSAPPKPHKSLPGTKVT